MTDAVSSFALDNGMQVVVAPDHRAPVVTHMVWYRNGSADDPPGKSGIAHFLEHLMFKGTEKHPKGAFSALVSELGGQENAFTSYDYTAYFQKVAKEHLERMMEFEADRMANLALADEDVLPERDVVLEERRMRTDSDPAAQLSETLARTLYVHHSYGLPIIGWRHEIEGLSREDALAYYRRFYTPENAILVVAGDVTAEEVRAAAERTYGRIPARGEPPRRNRVREPEIGAARRAELADPKVEQPSFQRYWLAPSHRTAQGRDAYALEVLAFVLGGGPTSRLYRALVQEKRIAVNAGAWYMGDALDETRFAIYAIPAADVALPAIEAEVERVVAAVAEGVDERELQRARTRLVAEAIYARDSQASMARIYGATLATGGTLEDVALWPERIEAVTTEEVAAAARRFLPPRRSVTGYLLKAEAA